MLVDTSSGAVHPLESSDVCSPTSTASTASSSAVSSPSGGSYTCSFSGCKSTFTSASSLARHMRSHSGTRPYLCPWPDCGKRFGRRFTLTRHYKIHTGETPYCCDYPSCDKQFNTSGNLARHKRIHIGQRPHECTSCHKLFFTSGKLKRHMRTHGLVDRAGEEILDARAAEQLGMMASLSRHFSHHNRAGSASEMYWSNGVPDTSAAFSAAMSGMMGSYPITGGEGPLGHGERITPTSQALQEHMAGSVSRSMGSQYAFSFSPHWQSAAAVPQEQGETSYHPHPQAMLSGGCSNRETTESLGPLILNSAASGATSAASIGLAGFPAFVNSLGEHLAASQLVPGTRYPIAEVPAAAGGSGGEGERGGFASYPGYYDGEALSSAPGSVSGAAGEHCVSQFHRGGDELFLGFTGFKPPFAASQVAASGYGPVGAAEGF